jgi:SAM-dependent methyltransferase
MAVSTALEPAALARRALRRLLPRQATDMIHEAIGMFDYIRSPDRGAGWGPFNGQTARQALFVDIIAKAQPHAIVETGTFLGATTELMCQTGLPVFSIELSPRNYGFARARFWRRRNLKLFQGDSRTALLGLFKGPLNSFSGLVVFFYLDAHWNDDLPLAEEIDIILGRCPLAVVMVDDFEVPSDAGYGYDDYGPGKALVLDYIRTAISAHQLQAFYPSTPSVADYPSTPMAAEGLAAPGRLRRGCVVLAKKAYHGPRLSSIPLLRAATEVEI